LAESYQKMSTDQIAAAEEDKQHPNYWQEALESSLRAARKRNPTIILCGDRDCGKENLVQTASEESDVAPHLLLDYTNIPFRDEDNDEEIARVNLWQVSDTAHNGMLQSVIRDVQTDDLCYCVVLDASKPDTVKTNFFKWMKFVEECQGQLTEKLEDEAKTQLKDAISRHIQFWQDPRDTTMKLLTDEEKAQIDTDTEHPKNNLGVPVMVVLANARNFGKRLNDAERNELFDTLINYIQKWSLDYGAASFTFLDNSKIQARRIIGYAVHRIQTEVPFRESPSIVVSISNLDEDFLLSPSGFVSPTLLSGSDADSSITFEQCFPESKPEVSDKIQKLEMLQAERDDQIFYREIMKDLGEPSKPSDKKTDQPSITRSKTEMPRKPRRGESGRDKRGRQSTRRSTKGPSGGTQQKEVVQNFFRHLLHSGNNESGRTGASSSRRSRASAGGKHKHQEALRALETLASKSKDRGR